MGLHDYIHAHLFALWAGVLCACISFTLIFRLWVHQAKDRIGRKLLWSVILCVPLFGWMAYGGFYRTLSENDVRAEGNGDATSGS
jgi:bacteriorhodopsin